MRLLKLVSITAWIVSVLAQDSSPGGPVHDGEPTNCNGWHTVVDGDTCRSIPDKYGITFDQFLEWNPAVSQDCLTNFWLNQAYCVRVGDRMISIETSTTETTETTTSESTEVTTTISPSMSSITTVQEDYSVRYPTTTFDLTTTSIDEAWPPQKTKEGQPSACNRWHLTQAGEDCEHIAVRYSISTNELIRWNPSISEDCSGLFVDWWVCVGMAPQGEPAKFPWSTEPPDFTAPPDPTDHTRTVHPTADSSFVPSPSQGPIPSSCTSFHRVEDGQTCREIVAEYGFLTQQQFLSWNPVLNGNCDGLWTGNYYCVADFESQLPLPPHVSSAPTPLPSGSPRDCVSWYRTTGSDTCALISQMFGTFSEDDFIRWNPSVLRNCNGIMDGVWYCVAKADTPTTRTDGTPSITTPPSSRPTQSGVTDACTSWWLVGSDDTCPKIMAQNSVSQTELSEWNPAIDSNCQGLEMDKYICVGIK